MSMRSVYRKIAHKNGVSVQEVKDEMQKAINEAWNNPNKTKEAAFMQAQFDTKGNAPTTEEFIRNISTSIKKNK